MARHRAVKTERAKALAILGSSFEISTIGKYGRVCAFSFSKLSVSELACWLLAQRECPESAQFLFHCLMEDACHRHRPAY